MREIHLQASMRVLRKKDCIINLRCDIITIGGWAFRWPREERRWSSEHWRRGARVIFTALSELERINNKIRDINNKILVLWKL